MALVEVEAGPHRITAAITRDAVEELGLVEGIARHGDRQGDLGDDRTRRRVRPTALPLTAAAICLTAVTGCGGGDDGGSGAARGLGGRVAAAGLHRLRARRRDRRQTVVRGIRRAGRTDPAGDQARRLRRREHDAARPALKEGLVGSRSSSRPTPWSSAVPDGAEITSIGDLTKPGTAIAIGDPEVPVGSYTREVLDRLPPDQAKAILANVRSEEPDVSGIVGKLTQGAVDAGFVYVTDVTATRRSVEGDRLPAGPAARRRLWSRGRHRGGEPRWGKDLHRRPASRRRGGGPAEGRLQAATGLKRGGVRLPSVRGALRGAGVPDAADRRDLRRHLARAI